MPRARSREGAEERDSGAESSDILLAMQFLPGTEKQSSRRSPDDLPKYHRCESRLEETVGEWDRHVASCPECLSYGVHLCAVGECLGLEAGLARARLDKVRRRLSQPVSPWLGLRLRYPSLTLAAVRSQVRKTQEVSGSA
jgi:hypothetical protein